MNDWQLAQQIAFLAKAMTWPSGDKVFKSEDVVVSYLEQYLVMKVSHVPALIIRYGNQSTTDANKLRADEKEMTIHCDIVHSVPGDQTGSATLLGRNQTAGVLGKGILEIKEKLESTIELLTQQNGVEFYSVSSSSPDPQSIGDNRNLCYLRITYSAWGTRQRTYPRPIRFRATGSVSFTWTSPPSRYDSTRVEIWRHTAEITSYGMGTIIYTGTGTSTTNSPGSGTWYYSIFAIYTEPGNATEQTSLPFNYRIVV